MWLLSVCSPAVKLRNDPRQPKKKKQQIGTRGQNSGNRGGVFHGADKIQVKTVPRSEGLPRQTPNSPNSAEADPLISGRFLRSVLQPALSFIRTGTASSSPTLLLHGWIAVRSYKPSFRIHSLVFHIWARSAVFPAHASVTKSVTSCCVLLFLFFLASFHSCPSFLAASTEAALFLAELRRCMCASRILLSLRSGNPRALRPFLN